MSKKYLHSETGPALRWSDGSGFFFLYGRLIDEELWERAVSREMSLEEIEKIKNDYCRFPIKKLYEKYAQSR